MNEKCIQLNQIQISNQHPITIIAGTNVIEENQINLEVAHTLQNICQSLELPFIFKASFDKANRSRHDSYRGKGIDMGFALFEELKYRYQIPCLTDIHEGWQFKEFADVIDIFQIPAFLCRQTDLLIAAAQTGKIVNVKKGQFLSGASMKFAVDKIKLAGNEKIMLTERGNTFGYQDLVVDYRNIPAMAENGVPVIMDCTHSLQQPNQTSGVTGGNPQLIETIAKAAIATGAHGLFIETHPNPAQAKSDGANMLPLDKLAPLLEKLVKLRKAVI